MRGALLIMLLIATLIVAALVIKDMQTGPTEDTTKKEFVDRAKETAQKVNKVVDTIRKTGKKAIEDTE